MTQAALRVIGGSGLYDLPGLEDAREPAAANPAFDVTPARLVTGIITERGVALASREGLLALYPEQAAA